MANAGGIAIGKHRYSSMNTSFGTINQRIDAGELSYKDLPKAYIIRLRERSLIEKKVRARLVISCAIVRSAWCSCARCMATLGVV